MKTKYHLTSFVVGVLFALGLGISGMTQPQNILGFLDLFGDWDPSLIFVMAGAVSVHGLAYYLIKRRSSPLFATEFHWPKESQITKKLIIGSALFGMGWGLSGFCPGPGLTSLASGQSQSLLFVVSLAFGMFLHKKFQDRQKS